MAKKKFLILLVVVVAGIIIAVVCFNNKNKPYVGTPIQTDFSVEIELMYDGWMASGILVKSAEEYSIKLNEPEAIQGMEFKYDGESVTINYLGLSAEVNNDSLLLNSVSSAVINTINHALSGSNTTVVESGENYIVSGKIENGNYELEVEQDTGLPVSLKIKNIDLTCTFETANAEQSN